MILFSEFEAIATIASITIYIRTTYSVTYPNEIIGTQNALTIFFVFHYFLNLYSAPVRLAYLLSFKGFIDFISMVPIIFVNTDYRAATAIPQVLIFFRVLRVLPLIRRLGFLSNTIAQQMILLCAWVIAILFVGAGIFQWVEKETTPQAIREEKNCSNLGCYTFFDSFYFMVVTVSTVGYGDITANSNLGRAVVILALVMALTYIPAQVNRILVIASRRPYGGTFSARKVVGSRYIILWGVASLRAVQEFLSQVYHPTHDADLAAFPLRVVIMAPNKPSFELRSLIGLYGGLVEYIEGRLMKPGDLERVSARSASAFFLLAHKHVPNIDEEDSMQFIRALAVHSHCGPNVRLVVEMLKPRNQGGAIWDDTTGVEVICCDVMRFKLLARSCFIKGLTTFCTNLFRTGLTAREGPKELWMSEYGYGQENEVYPLLLPQAFHHMLYEEVVEFVFRHFAVVIFGLDVPAAEETGPCDRRENGGKRRVFLYPRGHVISPSDVALAISPGLCSAEKVSSFGSVGRATLWQYDGVGSERRSVFAPQNLSKKVRRENLAKAEQMMADIRARWQSEEVGLARKDIGPGGPSARTAGSVLDDSSGPPLPMTGAGPASLGRAQADGVEMVGRGTRNERRERDLVTKLPQVYTEREVDSGHMGPPAAPTKSLARGSPAAGHASAVEPAQTEGSAKVVPGGTQTQASVHQDMSGEGQPSGQLPGSVSSIPEGSQSHEPGGPSPPSAPSLEEVVEKVLAWPSSGGFAVRPHPAVLDHHEAEILENLASRTLTAVYLQRPHILVAIPTGWPENFFNFVAAMRGPGSPSPPIVILQAEDPTHQQWGCIGHFPEVYFVQGSPMYELDLMRGGIFNAEKVVVLATDATPSLAANDTDSQSQMYDPACFSDDVRNVVIVANVERLLKYSRQRERVLCELQHEMSFSYLRPKYALDRSRLQRVTYERNREAIHNFLPAYMEGKAFCPSALRFLMYKTFYNRNTVTIMEQLVGGSSVEGAPSVDSEDVPIMRRLQQIPVPAEFADATYEELFVELLHMHQMLALGLYRSKGTMGSPTSYVFTNPSGNTVVHKGDLVYVLV